MHPPAPGDTGLHGLVEYAGALLLVHLSFSSSGRHCHCGVWHLSPKLSAWSVIND